MTAGLGAPRRPDPGPRARRIAASGNAQLYRFVPQVSGACAPRFQSERAVARTDAFSVTPPSAGALRATASGSGDPSSAGRGQVDRFDELDNILRSDSTVPIDLEHPLVRGDARRLKMLFLARAR